MTQIKDEQLIEGLRAGKENAYRMLFRLHYPALCYYAMQYVHDVDTAESIVAEVIEYLWFSRQRLAITVSLRSYLMQSVHNRCLDHLKYERRHGGEGLSVDVDSIHGGDDFADEANPLGWLIANELEAEIARAIEMLPPETARVFTLSRFEGLSQAEISHRLGISINTVKYHMRSALQRLHAALGKHLWMFFTLFM